MIAALNFIILKIYENGFEKGYKWHIFTPKLRVVSLYGKLSCAGACG